MTIHHTRVTKQSVDRLAVGATIRDTDLVGFGARRQKGAAVTYFLQRRIGARIRWVTIGRHGSPWTPETARKEAYRMLGQLADGLLPTTRRDDLDTKPTITDTAKSFMTSHGTHLKEGSRIKYQYVIDAYIVPQLGDKLLDSVARADVMKLHTSMAKKPPLANYTVSVLSKLMTWAEEHGLRPLQSNPCWQMKRYRENKRQRFLCDAEYQRLGQVLSQTETINEENLYIVAAVRLLLLTGARVGEIITLQWSWVDLDRQLLVLPDSKTGQKIIRMNGAAVAVLKALPRRDGNPHVICGRREGASLVNLEKPWRRIRAEAGLEDVRLHDLRHSFASVAAAQKGSLPMIGRLLGHSNTRTTARYAHLADDPVDGLNASVGETIAEAIGNRSEPTKAPGG